MRHEVQTSSPADHCRHAWRDHQPIWQTAKSLFYLELVEQKKKESPNRKEGARRKYVLLTFARSVKISLSKTGTKNFTSCSMKCFYLFSPFISTKRSLISEVYPMLHSTTQTSLSDHTFLYSFYLFFQPLLKRVFSCYIGRHQSQGVIQLCPQ